MRTRSSKSLSQLMSSALLCGAFLAGCAEAPSLIGPIPIATADAPPVSSDAPGKGAVDADAEELKTLSVSSLSPTQGLDDQSLGARIRWAGVVHHLSATHEGVCLTVLYARSDENGAPLWTNEPTYQSFLACTRDAYDPALVSDFTNITVVGRISGKTSIGLGGGTSSGPIVQIEKIFRWTDCLEGDASPQCKQGFIVPQAAPVT